MADVKKILVVDDHFEMLEFLRSMLEMSNKDYEVLAVPSAEEGLLELKRTHFDLLITDVRLPGMSGFDLVRQVRRLRQRVPVIMITAYSSPQGQKEAADLNVERYFRKPLDSDAVLTAVHIALYGEEAPIDQPIEPPAQTEKGPVEVISNRLETLRADTGADSLLLITIDGAVMLQLGEDLSNAAAVAQATATNIRAGFQLATLLDSNNPLTIQFHTGHDTELYLVNVNEAYVVALLFDAQARRGRIGTIWVFAQRAIKDLLEILPAFVPSDTTVAPVPEVDAEITAVPSKPEPEAEEPAPEPEPASSPEEIAALTNLFAEISDDADDDLDAFWDEALTGDETQDNLRGLSLEEAQARGLIPREFTQSEDSDDT